MSLFESRRGRYFHSRSRTNRLSPSGARNKFRGRSREGSISRDRSVQRLERSRPREKFDKKLPRERLERSRSRERMGGRTRERFSPSYSRGKDAFGMRTRSQDRFGYKFQEDVDDRPAEEPSDFGRSTYHEPEGDQQLFQDMGDLPDYPQGRERYWRNSNQDQGPPLSHARDDVPEEGYISFPSSVPAHISEPFTEAIGNAGNVLPDWREPRLSQHLPNFEQQKGSDFISEFNPDNPQITSKMWIAEIDTIGNEKGWSSDEKKYHFSSKLLGSAKDWFISGNRILESWQSLKKQFVKSFPSDMDYYKFLVAMISRVKLQDESLSNYFSYKTALLNTCSITGRKAVSCLIGGLSDGVLPLKHEATAMNFETPEELYNFLSDKDVDTSKTFGKKLKKPIPEKVCFGCRNPGHEIADCPAKKPKKRDVAEKRESKYFKNIYVNDVAVKAYFDVNFSNITMRIKEAHIANIDFQRKITVINGASGQKKITTIAREQVHLKIDSLVCKVHIYIVPNHAQTAGVVLGRDILKYANLIENESSICFTEKAPNKKSAPVATQERSTNVKTLYDEFSHDQSFEERHLPDRAHSKWTQAELSVYKRKERQSARSPVRRRSPSPPSAPRMFEKSHPFLSKSFYGNPY